MAERLEAGDEFHPALAGAAVELPDLRRRIPPRTRADLGMPLELEGVLGVEVQLVVAEAGQELEEPTDGLRAGHLAARDVEQEAAAPERGGVPKVNGGNPAVRASELSQRLGPVAESRGVTLESSPRRVHPELEALRIRVGFREDDVPEGRRRSGGDGEIERGAFAEAAGQECRRPPFRGGAGIEDELESAIQSKETRQALDPARRGQQPRDGIVRAGHPPHSTVGIFPPR